MELKCVKHNDLRLENILVRDNGTVVLIDFGNADILPIDCNINNNEIDRALLNNLAYYYNVKKLRGINLYNKLEDIGTYFENWGLNAPKHNDKNVIKFEYINVIVNVLVNKKIYQIENLKLHLLSTIRQLKKLIIENWKLEPNVEIKFYTNYTVPGEYLNEETTLEDANISNGDVIFATLTK